MSTQVKNTSQKQTQDVSLKHGQFKVNLVNDNDKSITEHIVSSLTQEELADGWNLVLPREMKKSTVHHFSVYLSQLPPHLWKYLRTERSEQDNSQHFSTIRDNIYHYSIKSSKYDDDVQKLYNLIVQNVPCKEAISNVYTLLEQQRIKGWVMIRAKKFLNA